MSQSRSECRIVPSMSRAAPMAGAAGRGEHGGSRPAHGGADAVTGRDQPRHQMATVDASRTEDGDGVTHAPYLSRALPPSPVTPPVHRWGGTTEARTVVSRIRPC